MLGLGSLLVALGPSGAAPVAPVLVSLSHDLADTAGGDVIEAVIEYGPDENALGFTVTVGGVSATTVDSESDGPNRSLVRFEMPTLAAGVYDVVLTPVATGVPSNALPIEAWAPTDDPDVTLLFDSKHTPYDPVTGIWEPRYSLFPPAESAMQRGSLDGPSPPAVDGAPSLPGSGLSAGLISNGAITGGILGYYLTLGEWIDAEAPGSLAAVFSSTNEDIDTAPHYGMPFAVGNYTLGFSVTNNSGGQFFIRSVNYNGGYVLNEVATTRGAKHAAVSRWGMPGKETVELSVDGALSGPGFSDALIARGMQALNYAAQFNVGLSYPATAPAYQVFIGVVSAFAVLKAGASDAFVDRWNRWKRARFPD